MNVTDPPVDGATQVNATLESLFTFPQEAGQPPMFVLDEEVDDVNLPAEALISIPREGLAESVIEYVCPGVYVVNGGVIKHDALLVTEVSVVLIKLPPGAGAHPYCAA